MTLYHFIFYFFEVVAALSALSVVFARNVFHAALLLIVCLLCIAGIYVLSFAEFVAVTQILIYAGGILVVIIFGIMITSKLGGLPLKIPHGNIFSGSLAASGLAGLLIYLFSRESFEPTTYAAVQSPDISIIGINLMTEYLIPFEIAGILLLVALVGAAVIASNKKREA